MRGEEGVLGRISPRVEASTVGDLLDRPPRAAIAFVADGCADAVPVDYRGHGGRHWVGVAREVLAAVALPARVALLIDDGRWWFELRGIMLRGTIAPSEAPPGGSPELAWLELVPGHAAAWDYAALREEADA